jgi:ELWxxDGT repeat protein
MREVRLSGCSRGNGWRRVFLAGLTLLFLALPLTADEARLVRDINLVPRNGPGGTTEDALPENLTPFRGGVLFTADRLRSGQSPAGRRELWFSDGAESGTSVIGPNATQITACGERAFFTSSTSQTGEELWVTTGTAASTSMVKDLRLGVSGSRPHALRCVDGQLLFLSNSETGTGDELWRSDGTAAGTLQVHLFSGPVRAGVALHHRLYFAVDGLVPMLWRSDGTPGGTIPLQPVDLSFQEPFAIRQFLYFQGPRGLSPDRVTWRTDGTEAGTVILFGSEFWVLPLELDGGLVLLRPDFLSGQSSTENNLCSTDEAGGILRCFDRIGFGDLGRSVMLNGRLFYRNGDDLKVSDGKTSRSTGLTGVVPLAAEGGLLYLSTPDGIAETDGTIGGTRPILHGGRSIAASGGRLYIAAGELYVYELPVTATSFAPSRIPMGGDARVTIRGRGFTQPVSVKVGETEAEVVEVTSETITFIAPPRELGAYTVKLTLGDGRRMVLDEPLVYQCASHPLAAIVSPPPAPSCATPTALEGRGGIHCAWFPGTGLDDASSCTPHATLHNAATYTLMVFDENGCVSFNNPTVYLGVTPSRDAEVSIAAPIAPVAGTTSVFIVNVTNRGCTPLQDLILEATVSAPLFSVERSGGVPFLDCGVPAPSGKCTLAPHQLLQPGATTSIAAYFTIPSSAPAGSVITSRAVLMSPDAEADLSNNVATAEARTVSIADLRVAPVERSIAVEGFATVMLSITNDGPSDAAAVTAEDLLPPGTRFEKAWIEGSEARVQCTAVPRTDRQLVTCILPALPSGQAAVLVLQARITSVQEGPLRHTATVTSSSPDPRPLNNTFTADLASVATPIPALSEMALLLVGAVLALTAILAIRH